jgi:hypothetical protein
MRQTASALQLDFYTLGSFIDTRLLAALEHSTKYWNDRCSTILRESTSLLSVADKLGRQLLKRDTKQENKIL